MDTESQSYTNSVYHMGLDDEKLFCLCKNISDVIQE